MKYNDPFKRKTKADFLFRFLFRLQLCGLQEVHGSEASFRAYFPLIVAKFFIFSSFIHDKPGTGGVITLFERANFNSGVFIPYEIAEGRILRTLWTGANKSVVTWNVHNFDISLESRKLFFSWLSQDLVHARDRPTTFVVYLLGDFNFIPPGEVRHKVKNPG